MIRNYMFLRNRLWETLCLLLISFTLFRPDFWQDMVAPPFLEISGTQMVESLDRDGLNGLQGDRVLRVRFTGPDFDNADQLIDRNSIL